MICYNLKCKVEANKTIQDANKNLHVGVLVNSPKVANCFRRKHRHLIRPTKHICRLKDIISLALSLESRDVVVFYTVFLTMVTSSFKNVQVTDIAAPFNVRIGQFFFTFFPLSTNSKLILLFYITHVCILKNIQVPIIRYRSRTKFQLLLKL